MLIVQINSSSNEQKIVQMSMKKNFFELLVVSASHVLRIVVQTNNIVQMNLSSNGGIIV